MKTPELWDAAASVSLFVKVMDVGYHLFLLLTVGIAMFSPGIMLMMRSVMSDTFSEDYITTAKAKGLTERKIRDYHASRNVMLPMVTAFTLSPVSSFGGSMILESVFSWPGLGAKFILNFDS